VPTGVIERVGKPFGAGFPEMSLAMDGQRQAHMGEAERLWSEASCDRRTTAICDCWLDPKGVLVAFPGNPAPKGKNSQEAGYTGN